MPISPHKSCLSYGAHYVRRVSCTANIFQKCFDDFVACVQLNFKPHTAFFWVDHDLLDEPVHKAAVKLISVKAFGGKVEDIADLGKLLVDVFSAAQLGGDGFDFLLTALDFFVTFCGHADELAVGKESFDVEFEQLLLFPLLDIDLFIEVFDPVCTLVGVEKLFRQAYDQVGQFLNIALA